MISFKGRNFPKDVILMGIRWYVSYPLSYRHVEELMEERGIKFDHGYETDVGEKGAYFDEISNEKLIDIKSLQMNEKAFSFYNLKVSKGTEIPWDNITYTSSQKMMIPVILGSNYLDSYAIGDQLKGTLYFETFDFKVVGFLAENSSVYYKNDINKFIDSVLTS